MKICPSCKSEFGGGEVFCPNDGARLASHSQWDKPRETASSDRLVGTILSDRYRIIRQIGEGGMGLVYEAEHVTIEKRVALKILRDDFSSRPEVVERFRQEAKSATKIGNEHIIDISDFGVTPSGASYFAMELLEGEDLANVLEREGTIDLERAADIILQCCKALGAAHAKGIVHRDMKPENIFLTVREERADFVKIVDFGIAKMSDIETAGAPGRKLTKTGMIFGTPEYMSPEQAAGKALDHRVDIYALAVILFEMLTGRVPFIGDTFMGILTQHMFEDPPRLEEVSPTVEVPDAVAAFIYRGLAKDPAERFQTCEEMAASLKKAMQGVASVRPPPKAASPVAPPTREESATREVPVATPRSRTWMLGAAVVVLAAGLGAGAVWYLGQNGSTGNGSEVDPRPINAVATGEPDSGASSAEPLEPAASDAGAVAVAVGEPVPEDAGPALVTVRVETSPEGARLYVTGRGEVCTATPCTFETAPGEAITLRARRGRAEAESELTPSANTVVQLELRATRRPSGQGGSSGGGGGGGIGDLKIPDFARRP